MRRQRGHRPSIEYEASVLEIEPVLEEIRLSLRLIPLAKFGPARPAQNASAGSAITASAPAVIRASRAVLSGSSRSMK